MLREIVDIIETDCVVTRRYRGPLYQSRYGLYFDPNENLAGYYALHDLQRLMDGSRTCLEIATTLGIDYPFVKKFADALLANGLADAVPRASLRSPTYQRYD